MQIWEIKSKIGCIKVGMSSIPQVSMHRKFLFIDMCIDTNWSFIDTSKVLGHPLIAPLQILPVQSTMREGCQFHEWFIN